MTDLHIIAHGRLQRGSGGRSWARTESRLREIFGGSVEISFTAAPGDATRLTRVALESGAGWLAAAGGDGTIHEVVNGFFDRGANIRPNVPLSFLPCGSGNDWARTIGIPTNPLGAAEALPRSSTRYVDVGLASFLSPQGTKGERVFLNVAEAGAGSMVVERKNESHFLARTRLGYRLNAVAAALAFRRPNLQLLLDGNETITTGPVLSLIIAGGQYFGAGMRCAPMAQPDDGWLEVIIVGNFGRAELLFKIRRFFSGTYLRDCKIIHQSARSISARSADRVSLELDGELVGTLPASFCILPSALAIRCG